MAKLQTNASGDIWWSKLKLMQALVAKFATNKVTPVTDCIAWVRCASGNVWRHDQIWKSAGNAFLKVLNLSFRWNLWWKGKFVKHSKPNLYSCHLHWYIKIKTNWNKLNSRLDKRLPGKLPPPWRLSECPCKLNPRIWTRRLSSKVQFWKVKFKIDSWFWRICMGMEGRSFITFLKWYNSLKT